MAKKETAAKAAPVRKDMDLDGVKVVYVDTPSRIQRVYEKRKAAQPELTKGDIFVHAVCCAPTARVRQSPMMIQQILFLISHAK